MFRLLHTTGKGVGSIGPEGVGSLSPVSESSPVLEEGAPLALEGVGSIESEGVGSLSPVSSAVPEDGGLLAPEGVGSTELRGFLLRSRRESRGRERRAHTWTGKSGEICSDCFFTKK